MSTSTHILIAVLALGSLFLIVRLVRLKALKAKYSILLTEDEYVNVCPPSVDVFMSFLRFLYTGSMHKIMPPQTALYILRTLDFFSLVNSVDEQRLRHACRVTLSRRIQEDSALSLPASANNTTQPRITRPCVSWALNLSPRALAVGVVLATDGSTPQVGHDDE